MPSVTFFQHLDCEGPGVLADTFRSHRVDLKVLRADRGDKVPDRLGDGLVVLGGPMGVYEEAQHPWMTAELNAIRRCLELSIPVLGICLGSQMLAHAAGARVFRGALPEVGWYPVGLTEAGRMDPLLMGLPASFDAFHWHGDTFTLPPGAKLLAGSAWYPHQAFRVGTNAYGFQCHLEVTEPMVRDWSRVYAKELTPQGGPIRPERIETDLAPRIQSLRSIAQKVFTRFAALL